MTTLAPPTGIHIGPKGVPKHTLGWDVIGWMAENLLQPDGVGAGEPFKLTDEQARFLLWWYAIDARGRFIYRSGMLRRMKGWGKDPTAAALCCVEFVGPCRFGGWEDGKPIVVPHYASWVQVAAVSKDQTRNTMTLFAPMLSRKTIEEHQIDLGKEIIYGDKGRRRIEAVTSSPRALEGGRATLIIKNESHHWIASNEGIEMSSVISRNAAKSRDGSSRVLAISNAHAPGEDSDAEHDYEAWKKAEQGLTTGDMLYDSLEAPPLPDLHDATAVREAIIAARGDSVWLDADRLTAEVMDPRTTPAMARRFYLNQIVAEEDKPFDSKKFAALAKPGYRVKDGALITLGFDGSIARDHTALVGTEIETGHQWVVGYWEPQVLDSGEVRIPFMEVDETVDDAFKRWVVWRFNCDPFYWKDMTAAWAGRYGADKVVDWPTNQYRKMAVSLLAYKNAITTGALSHDGHPQLLAAISNAHKHMQQFRDDQGNPMWVIQKERPDSPLKIDAAMAACLSWEAYTAAVAAGATVDDEVGVFFVGGQR